MCRGVNAFNRLDGGLGMRLLPVEAAFQVKIFGLAIGGLMQIAGGRLIGTLPLALASRSPGRKIHRAEQ